MNKERWRNYKHKVFFFDHRKRKVREFSMDGTVANIVQIQQFACLLSRYGANLYVGSHPCI